MNELEKKVLVFVAKGYSTAEIAHRLELHTHKIETIRQDLLLYFNARNAPHMVAQAFLRQRLHQMDFLFDS